MTNAQPTPQSQPNDRRALSHLTHGLTGSRIYLFSDAEQQAYDDLCHDLTHSLAPVGEAEIQITRQLCSDRWRLQRAAQFESAIFAERSARFASDPKNSTGDPLLDSCIANGETWVAEAKNLNLLSLYENRIHRRWEKNMAELRRLQTERKAALEAAIAEAALLEQAAEITGQTCDATEPFTRRNFEFSASEIARMIGRYRRLKEAQKLCASSKKLIRMAA